MQLFTNSRSPYARKARIIAIEKSIDLEIVISDLQNKPEGLLANNPLTQIPTLVDNGYAVFDSPVVCEYLDYKSDAGPRFFPSDFKNRIDVLKVQAVADGVVEFAIRLFMEKIKPSEQQDTKLISRNRDLIKRSVEFFENYAPNLKTEAITIAEASIVSAYGYLNFRLGDEKFFENAPKLNAWVAKTAERPSFKITEPKLD